MDKVSKKILCPLMLAVVFAILNILILTGCREDNIPSKFFSREDISKEFTDNSEEFQLVAEFLKNMEENVFIEKLEDGNFSSKKSDNSKIQSIKPFEVTDEEVKNAIEYILHELNYKYISEDGNNGIYFVRQTSLRFAHGIAYSKDNNEPDWGTVEELEHIDGNWYYYKGY